MAGMVWYDPPAASLTLHMRRGVDTAMMEGYLNTMYQLSCAREISELLPSHGDMYTVLGIAWTYVLFTDDVASRQGIPRRVAS